METKIAFSPRGNKVLLRADFEVSTLNILNNEEINKIPAKAYTVMAVAENVKGLNIGDKVKLENGCIPTLIQIPGDTQTLAAKQKIHRDGKSIVGVGTVKFSEFVPRVGRFEYSPAKFFKKTHAEELEGLSREERKAKIIAYHIANRRRRRTAEEDGKKMRFRKDFAKG